VNTWMQQHTPVMHKRILLELRRDPLTITPTEGYAIAQQVCAIIGQEGRFSGTTHLFGAMPFGVALLIGRQLQAVGKIQSYELDPARDGQYQPTCRIRAF